MVRAGFFIDFHVLYTLLKSVARQILELMSRWACRLAQKHMLQMLIWLLDGCLWLFRLMYVLVKFCNHVAHTMTDFAPCDADITLLQHVLYLRCEISIAYLRCEIATVYLKCEITIRQRCCVMVAALRLWVKCFSKQVLSYACLWHCSVV